MSPSPFLWQRARAEAAKLAAAMAQLGWPQRARLTDQFLWSEAGRTLTSDQITAVINRVHAPGGSRAAVEAYRAYAVHVVTALLSVLRDTLPVTGPSHAILLLLTDKPALRDAGEAWLAEPAHDPRATLAGLPGHAFVLLALHRSDSALGLMARDAFRTALLGHE